MREFLNVLTYQRMWSWKISMFKSYLNSWLIYTKFLKFGMWYIMKFLLFLLAFVRCGWISDNLVLSEHFKNSDAGVAPVAAWGVFIVGFPSLVGVSIGILSGCCTRWSAWTHLETPSTFTWLVTGPKRFSITPLFHFHGRSIEFLTYTFSSIQNSCNLICGVSWSFCCFCLLSIAFARCGWVSDNLVLGEHLKIVMPVSHQWKHGVCFCTHTRSLSIGLPSISLFYFE